MRGRYHMEILGTNSTTPRSTRRRLSGACALLAAFCFLTIPAWPQYQSKTCTAAAKADMHPDTTTGFWGNYAANCAYPASTYCYAIPLQSGQNSDGDLNSTYFPLYYSIANATATGCHLELILVGKFPDSRYFSIADNDMHATPAQHLADANIDSIAPAQSNPFLPGMPYNGNQNYLVPVSLGYLPGAGVSPGCSIVGFQEDNLMDATQRHANGDWNTDLADKNTGKAHVVDLPDHTAPTSFGTDGSNTGGYITVRSYLPPTTCSSTNPGSCSPDIASQQQPYLLVRDADTGCAYSIAALETNKWLDAPALGTGFNNPTTAIVSSRDVSKTFGYQNWLDNTQIGLHKNNISLVPQECYANGSVPSNNARISPTQVAWTRGGAWVGGPGPDDAYIGAAVPASELSSIKSNSQVIRFRLQLPNMPNTPCEANASGVYPCSLTGNEQLRYMSLTFGWQGPATGGLGGSPASMVSLADTALAPPGCGSPCYVTLLVNVGGTLPSWLQQTSSTPGGTTGAAPVSSSSSAYTVWYIGGYTVLDLNPFLPANFFTSSDALILTLRNTMANTTPGSAFQCSGASVPFSTAVYTNVDGNGGTLMGPYLPVVDYANPNDQNPGDPGYVPLQADTSAMNLPSPASCGQLPNGLPTPNSPGLTGNQCGPCVAWPQQYWPSSTAVPPYLACGVQSTDSTKIGFVATQFTTIARAGVNVLGTVVPCTSPSNPCTQINAQYKQLGGQWQPPLPVAIVGMGFGFLPNVILPYAGPASSLKSPSGVSYLQISSDGAASGVPWNTATSTSCQVYITNWTDTSIALVANLPLPNREDGEGTFLSPLSDMSLLTFFQSLAPGAPPVSCPVAYSAATGGDNLTFTVTNPQSLSSYQITTSAKAASTPPL